MHRLASTIQMFFFLLASLIASSLALTPPKDADCTMPAATGTDLNVAPNGLTCTDVMAPTTCALVFGGATAGVTAEAGHREAKCEAPAELKKMAIEQCPKFCGYCCKSPAYNCLNKPFDQTGLNCTTMADKCNDVTWRPLIAENCPSTCGMCLAGGCVDKAPDCASQATICYNVNFAAWAKDNCARTCNQCPAVGLTTAAPTAGPGVTVAPGATTAGPVNPPAACVDMDVNCANWASKGKFCNNSYYQAQWAKCRRSCGRC